ncbi:hypothetical protein ACFL7M_08140 [Thermodesulfobacteriota bacterium]
MKKTAAYKTGLSVSFIDEDEPKPPYKGKNWLSKIEKVEIKTHLSDEIIIYSKSQEVINVQNLSRRLILESLGFWRY